MMVKKTAVACSVILSIVAVLIFGYSSNSPAPYDGGRTFISVALYKTITATPGFRC